MSSSYKRCWHLALRCFLLGALSTSLVPAGVAQAGKICGIVQDQTKPLVIDAAVELSNHDTRLDAKTNVAGKFCFDRVEPGDCELSVQANGFRTDRQKISVHPAEAAYLTILLGIETANQQVTVVEGAADVGSLNVAIDDT